MSTYSFCGYPMTDQQVDRWPPRIPIRDDRDGTYVERARTAEQVRIPRCPCGRPVPTSSSCGCCCAEHDSTVRKAS